MVTPREIIPLPENDHYAPENVIGVVTAEQLAAATVVLPTALLASTEERLLAVLEAIPTASNEEAAGLYQRLDHIAANLAVLRTELKGRLVELAPVETYKYKGETRTRPAKQQVLPSVGIVAIEQSANREWRDKRELAHAMMTAQIVRDEGVAPGVMDTIDWLFALFSVGDPRTTVMAEMGFADFDNPDNGWVAKDFHQSVRVL